MQDFRNLKVWQSSRDLTCQVFQVSEHLPDQQIHTQLRNCCVLILANIVRACSQTESAHFVTISLDSLNLLEHRLDLAHHHHWISESEFAALSCKANEISKLLKRLFHVFPTDA